MVTRRSSNPKGDRLERSRLRSRYLPRRGASPAIEPEPGRLPPSGRKRPGRRSTPRDRPIDRTDLIGREQGECGSPPAVVLQGIIDDQRIAREDVRGDSPGDPEPAEHRGADEDRADHRACGETCDQQDQIDLLLKSRQEQADPDEEIDGTLAGPVGVSDWARGSGRPPRRNRWIGFLPSGMASRSLLSIVGNSARRARSRGTRRRSTISRMIASAAPNSPAWRNDLPTTRWASTGTASDLISSGTT